MGQQHSAFDFAKSPTTHLDLLDLIVYELDDSVLLVLLDVLLNGIAEAFLSQCAQLVFLFKYKRVNEIQR